MKDILSYETAVRLKEAGFPQPTPEAGQFWYNQFGAVSIIGKKEVSEGKGLIYFYCMSMNSGRSEKLIPALEDAFFAPTATDILRELGPLFDLSCDCGEFWCRDEKDWNPAEAAAEAWLKNNEKK